MSDTNAKQQIVDKIKDSTNILVTVSNNPSVDELSAALGLSLLLNKMKKHATAVFSGEIPAAINFLNPEKTFENTVDSLRDFIIALNKEKADHLRYKVEGDVVKIFITPYKTTITSEDLDFSQGDYNVELVLALGVTQQGSLDKALEAHGQIFDDATVATIVAGSESSDLGSIGWRDQSASSLSEMAVNLSDALKNDKSIVDEQIATAFLSGIVAATERFSNNRTSARVMKIASDLMAAGANQQLIASKFEEAVEEESTDAAVIAAPESPAPSQTASETPETTKSSDGTTSLSEGESTKVERVAESPESAPPAAEAANPDGGTLNISHEMEGTLEEVAQQKAADDQAAAAEAAEAAVDAAQPASNPDDELSDMLPPVVAPATADVSAEDLQKDIQAANAEVEAAAEAPRLQGAVSSEVWQAEVGEPTYGGTLNATAEAAADDARRLAEDDRNKTILSHGGGYIADQTPMFDTPLNATVAPPEEESIVNPLSGDSSPTIAAAPLQPVSPTLMDLDQQNRAPSIPELPPLPDFSTLPPLPPPPPVDMTSGALPEQRLGDILPPADQPPAAPASNDPGQFRIPGQS